MKTSPAVRELWVSLGKVFFFINLHGFLIRFTLLFRKSRRSQERVNLDILVFFR